MFISHSYILSILFLSNFWNVDNIQSQNTHKIVDKWNRLTIKSFSKQIDQANQISTKAKYRDELNSFKVYMNTDNSESTKYSTRYKFITQVISQKKYLKDFYIIETSQSGERIQIINYLIYYNERGKLEGFIYSYEKMNWIQKSELNKISVNLSGDLDKLTTGPDLGCNDHNVIIT